MVKQHIVIPNKMGEKNNLSPLDYFVYGCMRRHMDKHSFQTFVGLNTIAVDNKISVKSVATSVARLVESGDLIRLDKKVGRAYVYEFNKESDKFEMFTFEFLDIESLTPNEKGILMALQKYMFKDGSNYMATTYTFQQLSTFSGIPERTIKKAFKKYKENGMLSSVTTRVKDPETGLMRQAKMIDLASVCQAVIYVNERVDNIDKKVDMLIKENEELKKRLDQLAQAQLGVQPSYSF